MIRTTLRKLKYELRGTSLYWSRSEIRNWGDDINPWLYRKVTGKEAIYCPHQDVPRLLMAGSILDRAGPYDSCWGTGFISDSPRDNRIRIRKAFATRGPLTAEVLEMAGVPVNHVYGDPGIIAARCIMSEIGSVETHSMVGIIPHYVDVKAAFSLARDTKINVRVIPTSLPSKEFVAEVLKCSHILSSSLHGLVVAESLGVPSAWLCLSENVIGGSFKFVDYLLGTDRKRSDLIRHDAQFLCEIRSAKQISVLPAYNVRAVANKLLSVFPRARVLRAI